MPLALAAVVLTVVPAAPAPNAPLPSSPAGIARALASTDAALRRAIDGWQAGGSAALAQPTPDEVTLWALREQRLYRRLRANAVLATNTLPLLRQPLRGEAREVVVAGQELLALAADTRPNPHPPQPAPALPAGVLRAFYGEAQRRFAIPWPVLAAVNQVESGYGRLQNTSSAGAQGPMQFLPATWKAYGLGGDIHSPRDAVLGAGNYLHQSGAPADERRALFAYNHSRLYVRAVQAYAHAMARDPLGFLRLYAWEASLPATIS